MDPENQDRIKALADEHGTDNLVVVLGAADLESLEVAAETVTVGDPAYVGPLAGVQLGLPVLHVLEEDVKEQADPGVYDEQVGLLEMTLDVDQRARRRGEMGGPRARRSAGRGRRPRARSSGGRGPRPGRGGAEAPHRRRAWLRGPRRRRRGRLHDARQDSEASRLPRPAPEPGSPRRGRVLARRRAPRRGARPAPPRSTE